MGMKMIGKRKTRAIIMPTAHDSSFEPDETIEGFCSGFMAKIVKSRKMVRLRIYFLPPIVVEGMLYTLNFLLNNNIK